MNEKEQTEFARLWDQLKKQQNKIASVKLRIKKLSSWDKNGSHTKAIVEAIEEKEALELVHRITLNKRTIEDYQKFAKKLSGIKTRRAHHQKIANELTKQLEELKF